MGVLNLGFLIKRKLFNQLIQNETKTLKGLQLIETLGDCFTEVKVQVQILLRAISFLLLLFYFPFKCHRNK